MLLNTLLAKFIFTNIKGLSRAVDIDFGFPPFTTTAFLPLFKHKNAFNGSFRSSIVNKNFGSDGSCTFITKTLPRKTERNWLKGITFLVKEGVNLERI